MTANKLINGSHIKTEQHHDFVFISSIYEFVKSKVMKCKPCRDDKRSDNTCKVLHAIQRVYVV